jgi:hypothetical protein
MLLSQIPNNPKTLEISNSFIIVTIKLSKQNTISQLKSVSTETPKFPTLVMLLSQILNNPKTLEISNSFILVTIKLSKQNTNSQLKSVSTETPKFPTVVMFLSQIPNNPKTLEISKQIPYNRNSQKVDSFCAPHPFFKTQMPTNPKLYRNHKKMNEKDIHLLFRFG